MTVTVQTRPTAVVEIEHPGDLEERRRQALAEAISVARAHAEGRAVDPDCWVPAIALRGHGRGCVTLALAGSFDAAGIEYLRTTTRDLDLLATVELVVDCSALTRCDVALARVLAGLRRRRLEAGTRIELHAVPRELAREIGLGPG